MNAIASAPQPVRSIVFALVGLLAGALVETAWAQPAPLYSNGPMVSVPGGGAGGADASRLQNALGMTSLGFNAKLNGSSIRGVADDFTVPASGWNLTRITVFAYQTDSGPTSTLTDLRLLIFNGPPHLPTSSMVYGNPAANVLASTRLRQRAIATRSRIPGSPGARSCRRRPTSTCSSRAAPTGWCGPWPASWSTAPGFRRSRLPARRPPATGFSCAPARGGGRRSTAAATPSRRSRSSSTARWPGGRWRRCNVGQPVGRRQHLDPPRRQPSGHLRDARRQRTDALRRLRAHRRPGRRRVLGDARWPVPGVVPYARGFSAVPMSGPLLNLVLPAVPLGTYGVRGYLTLAGQPTPATPVNHAAFTVVP